MGLSHRTIETPVYYFAELSDEAKEKAREWWRNCESGDPSWVHERRQSLEAFCKEFPVEARDWEYDAWSYSVTAKFTGSDEEGVLSGPRLAGWLWNHHRNVLVTNKRYEIQGRSRLSRITYEPTSCPFTGYCMDENLLDPIRAFLEKPTDETLEDLLDDCLQAWGKAARDDSAWIIEDEQVDETIVANEYEFDEAGDRV